MNIYLQEAFSLNEANHSHARKFSEPIHGQDFKNEVEDIKTKLDALSKNFQLHDIDIETLQNILVQAKAANKHYNKNVNGD